MNKYLKRLKNPKILIPLLLIIIVSIPFISYLLGGLTSSRYPNWSRTFKDIAQYSSFGLLKEKEIVKMQEKAEENVNLITVSPSEIEIVNKRISVQNWTPGGSDTVYMFSALLKNNSQYGIPQLVIKSIKIYDEDRNLIGEKEDYAPAPLILVKGGEYPFSFGVIKEGRDWKPKSFDIDIAIPKFEVNENVVRLDVTNLELVERDQSDAPGEWGFKYVNYTYDLTIKNNTEEIVGDIYYIAFLKYKDLVFSTIEDSCCTRVYFEKDQDPVSLSEPETFSTLESGQEETIRIKMRPYDYLYEDGINEDEIELVLYVVGVIQ